MKQSCEKVSIKDIIGEEYYDPSFDSIDLFIDENLKIEFLKIIGLPGFIKKFRIILTVILSKKYNGDIYAPVRKDLNVKNITVMKFIGKNNFRIYCKEYFSDSKKVVMISLFHKKTQSYDKKIINLIKKIDNYEYELK